MDLETIDVSKRRGNGFDDLTGKTYGRLAVIGLSPKKSGRKSFWVCSCECGNKKLIRSDSLKDGSVQSCGCLKKEMDKVNLSTVRHSESHTRLHNIWLGIKKRCLNPKDAGYKRYGGRGITMCDEWAQSYEAFRDWANNNGYAGNLTIERIDVNLGYSPKNCTWIPFIEQANNRQGTIWVEWNGEVQNLRQWADELGIKYSTLNGRYHRGDRPPELFRKVDTRRHRGNQRN